jgi:DNA-binding transcriptional LysR family regulator
MILALANQHPLARAKPASLPIPLAQLSDELFILIGPPGTGLHDETIAACRSAGYSPRICQLTPSITPALGLAATGMGVVLVPESLKSLRMEGLVYRRVTGPYLPKAFLGLTYRKGNGSSVLKHFVTTVRATWRTLPSVDDSSASPR